jgi:hypothetical protein
LVIDEAIKETAGTVFARILFVGSLSTAVNIPAEARFKFHTAGAQGHDKRDTCGTRRKS